MSPHVPPVGPDGLDLGEHLHRSRIDLQMSTASVADRLGIDERRLVQIEAGLAVPPPALLEQLVDLYGERPRSLDGLRSAPDETLDPWRDAPAPVPHD